jgi:hypothetical protein
MSNIDHQNGIEANGLLDFAAILCDECRALCNTFVEAVHEVILLNEKHLLAVVDDDPDPHRFDILIHIATERKQNAKYAYIRHRELHGCSLENHDETYTDRT